MVNHLMETTINGDLMETTINGDFLWGFTRQ